MPRAAADRRYGFRSRDILRILRGAPAEDVQEALLAFGAPALTPDQADPFRALQRELVSWSEGNPADPTAAQGVLERLHGIVIIVLQLRNDIGQVNRDELSEALFNLEQAHTSLVNRLGQAITTATTQLTQEGPGSVQRATDVQPEDRPKDLDEAAFIRLFVDPQSYRQ